MIAFGVWDIFYYVWLKVALDCDYDRDQIRTAFADASGLA